MTEQNQTNLGKRLSEVRQLHGDSLEALADQLGVTKSYLSKIENGHRPVSPALLEKYAGVYGRSARFADVLGGHKVTIKEGERRSTTMQQEIQKMPGSQQLQVNLNPEKTPVMYTDWFGINSSDGGVMINFGQSAAPLPMHQIVARMGMSHAQAKQLYDLLGENLKQFYKSKNMEF